ncbi:MAG TPA: hypothetical protein VHZ24_06030 [Pirellulales bacterium]|jgi:hypothetical protein|nr:hypothetical protein [Pirellulales bacterium]
MLNEASRPLVGEKDNMLGARIPPYEPQDIVPDADRLVHPNTGGMSVVKNWRKLPALLIPIRLQPEHPPARGSDSMAIFRYLDREIDSGILATDIYLRWGRKAHGTIEPCTTMPIAQYQMASTQPQWSISEA